MKIDIQIPLIALSAHGGTRFLVTFANFAAERGYCVRILIPRGKIGNTYTLHPLVELYEIPISLGNRYLDYLAFLLACPFYLRCGTLVANFFVTVYPVVLASRLWKRPYVYFVQDIETKYKGVLGQVLNAACNLTYRSGRIVPASSYLAKQLRQSGARPLDEVNIGPTEQFIEREANGGEKSFDLIVFPRHEPWKGADRLKKVVALYRQKHGALSVLRILQNRDAISSFGDIGNENLFDLSQDALIDSFDRARVTLFTSYHEGFGMPPLEGMARGLPAVVYECGGSSIYMRDGENGFLIGGEDELGAVERLHQLLNDPVLYGQMATAARRTGEKFSVTVAYDRILARMLPTVAA